MRVVTVLSHEKRGSQLSKDGFNPPSPSTVLLALPQHYNSNRLTKASPYALLLFIPEKKCKLGIQGVVKTIESPLNQ